MPRTRRPTLSAGAALTHPRAASTLRRRWAVGAARRWPGSPASSGSRWSMTNSTWRRRALAHDSGEEGGDAVGVKGNGRRCRWQWRRQER
jgi:hypothetical protein